MESVNACAAATGLNMLTYGIKCWKANAQRKAGRETTVFLHPMEKRRLCWISKWKSREKACVDLKNAKVTHFEALEEWKKQGYTHAIDISCSSRCLTLAFRSKQQQEVLLLIIRKMSVTAEDDEK